FSYRLVINTTQHLVHYLAQTFSAKLSELSIDWNAPPNMNRSERRVALILFALFVLKISIPFIRLFAASPRLRVPASLATVLLCQSQQRVLRRRPRAGQHLQLVRLIQSQCECITPRVKLPRAVCNETSAACEALAV